MHEASLALAATAYFLSTLRFCVPGADDPRLARAARWAFAGGFAVHTLAIGVRCARGLPPVVSPADLLSFTSWALCLGFLAVQLRWRLPSVGAFLSPIAIRRCCRTSSFMLTT